MSNDVQTAVELNSEEQAYQQVIRELRLRPSGIPPRYWNCSPFGFEAYDTTFAPECEILKAQVEKFADEYDGGDKGIALAGGTAGCGKTHLAASLAIRLIERGFEVAWWNAADLFAKIRSCFDGRGGEEWLMDELSEVKVLFLDDLGVDRPAAWVLDRLYLIFNRRVERCLPLFLTTNFSSLELQERLTGDRESKDQELGERIVSRLKSLILPMSLKFPKKDFRSTARKKSAPDHRPAGANPATSEKGQADE